MSPFHTPTSSQRLPPADSAQKDNDPEGKEEETARLRRLNKLYKKLDAPPTFSGDESKDKITDVREWIDITDDYLRLHLEPSDLLKGGIIPFILVRTRGAAHDWLKTKMEEVSTLQKRGKLDKEIQWEELKNSFIEAFEGHEFRVLRKLELESLKLGHGDCKTIVLLNAKFDQLSRRLYPSGTELAALDAVLADEYGKIIERSDLNLWRDIHRMGIPTTLMQWKELTAQAWGSREIIRRKTDFHNNNRRGYGGGGMVRGYGKPTSSSSQVTINELDHQLSEGETAEWERMEGEPSASATIQTMSNNTQQSTREGQNVQGTKPAQHGRTFQQRQQLMKEGKCFWCCRAGHMINTCPLKQKGGKPATLVSTQSGQGSQQGKE